MLFFVLFLFLFSISPVKLSLQSDVHVLPQTYPTVRKSKILRVGLGKACF